MCFLYYFCVFRILCDLNLVLSLLKNSPAWPSLSPCCPLPLELGPGLIHGGWLGSCFNCDITSRVRMLWFCFLGSHSPDWLVRYWEQDSWELGSLAAIISAFLRVSFSFASDTRTPWSHTVFTSWLFCSWFSALAELLTGLFLSILVVANYFQVFDFLPRSSAVLSFHLTKYLLFSTKFPIVCFFILFFLLDSVFLECWDWICAVLTVSLASHCSTWHIAGDRQYTNIDWM